MALLKCKMCGGDLPLVEGTTVVECEYCGTVQTVPSADNEKKMNLFNRAHRLRRLCEFDKAAGVYEQIVADFPEEAEAYWGLVLCRYGIEYVDDPATGKKVPTCHRSSYSSILEDSDFNMALEYADVVARKVYRQEAKQIEEIRKSIIALSNDEAPYDIFICYKETDENGDRTLDSVLAQDIYDVLTDKGYRVFFSRISLEDKLGQEYEPYIFAALNSAKIMLTVGTDYEHFNAVWVKNEWSRFLKLMEKDKTKHLIPCFKGIDAYDMPQEFAKLQAQDLGKVGAVQDLLRGVEKLVAAREHTPELSKEAENRLEELENQLKKTKKRNKMVLLLIPVIFAALALGLGIFEKVQQNSIFYNDGIAAMEYRLYSSAEANFELCGNYKDAKVLYQKAKQYHEQSDAALKVLVGMDDFAFNRGDGCRKGYSRKNNRIWVNWVHMEDSITLAYWGYSGDNYEFGAHSLPENWKNQVVEYDVETGDYVFYLANYEVGNPNNLDDPNNAREEYFRAKLQEDGSLKVYNDDNRDYHLVFGGTYQPEES